jgi:3-isopropylmalate/(R)-2-methylmalate dehydratase large subunit
MKRRDFIKTSVGAGFAVSATPFAARYDQARTGKVVQQGQTMFDRVWDAHVIADLGGDAYLLQVDRCIGGSPNQVMEMIESGVDIPHPEIFFNVPDHGTSTSPDRYTDLSLGTGWQSYEEHADAMREMGFNTFGQFDPRYGIQHVVGPETGLSQPGMLLCAGDSHTCTHGAMGMISWGGENTSNVLRTGTVIRHHPMTMRVNVVGNLGPGLSSKDIILRIIAQLGTDGGSGYAVEYAGPVVRALPQDARFTICNLAVEMASLTGMVGPDDTTYEWMAGREFAPAERYWDQALAFWRTIPTDADAVFDREETVDMTGVEPQVTWGINPEHAIGISDRVPDPDDAPADKRETYRQAIEYSRLTPGDPILGTPIDEAFIGSCAESRIDDLRAAARVVEGRRVASNVVSAWVIAGSTATKRQAEAEGLDRIFTAAGFEWREPGCSKCYGSNGDYVAPGNRCISNSNRNYIGRQGRDTNTILASSSTVAASAIAGSVADVRTYL